MMVDMEQIPEALAAILYYQENPWHEGLIEWEVEWPDESKKKPYYERADQILSYLHYKGMVKKVD
ncbi:hypothetical protein ACFLTO_04005 [Chloroflexota bacterium]